MADPRVWYFVRDFDLGRDFYKRTLGFDETFVDFDDKFAKLERGGMRILIAEGEPSEAGVAVLDLAGQVRIVDVFDPDGNRVQLAQHFD